MYSTPIVNHLLMEVHPRLCAVVALHALYSQNQELNETNRDRTTTKDITKRSTKRLEKDKVYPRRLWCMIAFSQLI